MQRERGVNYTTCVALRGPSLIGLQGSVPFGLLDSRVAIDRSRSVSSDAVGARNGLFRGVGGRPSVSERDHSGRDAARRFVLWVDW